MKKTKEKKMKIRKAVEKDLLTSGIYRQKVEKDKTKYSRKRKHKGDEYV